MVTSYFGDNKLYHQYVETRTYKSAEEASVSISKFVVILQPGQKKKKKRKKKERKEDNLTNAAAACVCLQITLRAMTFHLDQRVVVLS